MVPPARLPPRTGHGGAYLERSVKRATTSAIKQVSIDTAAVTPEQVEKMMKRYDRDGDGTYSTEEVRSMMTVMAQEQKGRKLMKKVACISCLLFLLMLFGNAGLTFAVVFLSKETRISGGSTMVIARGGSSNVVATAEATVQVPLYVAPVLPVAQLGSLRWLSAKHLDVVQTTEANGSSSSLLSEVESIFHVSHVTKHSSVHIDFDASDGRTITIRNGDATLSYADSTGLPDRDLCTAKVECASFTVDASAEESLHTTALRALITANVVIDDDIRALPIVERLLSGPLAAELAAASSARTGGRRLTSATPWCMNSCPTSGNGVCEDDFFGTDLETVSCVLGADCQDCGTRESSSANAGSPSVIAGGTASASATSTAPYTWSSLIDDQRVQWQRTIGLVGSEGIQCTLISLRGHSAHRRLSTYMPGSHLPPTTSAMSPWTPRLRGALPSSSCLAIGTTPMRPGTSSCRTTRRMTIRKASMEVRWSSAFAMKAFKATARYGTPTLTTAA